jgi:hypothetical protein
MGNKNKWIIQNRVPICLLICILVIEIILYSQFWHIKINNFMYKIEIARRSLIVVIAFALVAHYQLNSYIQKVFEIFVYIVTAFIVIKLFIF